MIVYKPRWQELWYIKAPWAVMMRASELNCFDEFYYNLGAVDKWRHKVGGKDKTANLVWQRGEGIVTKSLNLREFTYGLPFSLAI